MRKKILWSLLASCLFLGTAIAQNVTINGKILSEKENTPIDGATIFEKNTKKVITSGRDGSFSISVKTGSKLVVSAVGYATKEVNAQNNITVRLAEDVKDLSEVVVTGVGVARDKRTVGIDLATL